MIRGLLLLILLVVLPFWYGEAALTALVDRFLARELDPWVVGAGIAALLAADVLLPIPSSVVTLAAGYGLGFAAGTVAATLGMCLGCVVGYALGIGLGRWGLRRLAGTSEVERVERLFERHGDVAVIVGRPIPVLAEASVIVAGVARMPLRRFLWLTTLGNLGIALVYAGIGALGQRVQWPLAPVLAALVLPALAILVFRRVDSA